MLKGKRQYYYTLTFDFLFSYEDHEIYFANCIPYTYTDLIRKLNKYQKYENLKYKWCNWFFIKWIRWSKIFKR